MPTRLPTPGTADTPGWPRLGLTVTADAKTIYVDKPGELRPVPEFEISDQHVRELRAKRSSCRCQFQRGRPEVITVMSERNRRPRRTREDYERGLPGYHDPTAGFGGASPARSALTLRAVLAAFGFVFCAVAAAFAITAGLTVPGALLAVLAATALVDLGWVIHRKRRGEPG